jgi:ribonuclease HII
MKKNILSKFYKDDNLKYEIGIDEAGRGPMFGRVYSACVILPKNDIFDYSLLKDSKKFTSNKKLLTVYNYIIENALYYSVNFCDEKTIDKINIRNATHTSMHLSIDEILKKNNNTECDYCDKFYLLVDGNDFKPYCYMDKNDEIKHIDHITIEGGDNKYCSIAAASILAKVERDKYIEDMCNKYPKLNEFYDLKNNKGYGTKKHLNGIKNNGISPWHRQTYGLCKTSNIIDYYEFISNI